MTTSQTDINTNSNNTTTTAGTSISNNAGGNGINGVERSTAGGGGGGVVTTSKSTNSNNGSQHNIATISEVGKRKKLKSRNTAATAIPTTIPAIGGGNSGYTKDHLDAWLETCLKDASTTQLSSSSEFLDYNPTTNNNMMTSNAANSAAAVAAMSVNNLNHKNMFSIPPPSQQQQQQHQQQQPPVLFNMANLNQHQQSQQQQQQFAMRTNPMNNGSNNMPNNNSFNNIPFSQGFQRNMPNFMKNSSNSFNHRYSMMFPPVGGGYYPQNDGSQDFASLPPMVNIMGGSGGTSSEHENNSTDVLDGSGSNPNISRGFRFSDPCLLNPSDNDSKLSGQNTPDRRNNLPNDVDQNNKFFNILMEQIQLLHETNTKICRDLHEAKVLKHAPNLGMRHRRDSISGLSTHSQPMVFGSAFGTQSPAPSYHSGAYTPGMMTDVVREVKDAARVREDALLNRVKAMVEERQWSMNESNLRMMRDIEELKSQVHHLRVDRKETNKRLNHLEAENKYMRQMLAALYNNRSVPDIIYENETLRTRKSFPHSRRTQQTPMNLHYGTIHHQPATSSLDEQEEEPLHIVETPSTTSTADIASVTAQQRPPSDLRNSFSSSDGGSINGGNTTNKVGPIMSPPNFALVSSPADEIKRKKDKSIKKMSSEEGDNVDSAAVATITPQDLRRELKEAVAARKDADERIIALENLVKTLQVNTSHPPSSKATDNRLQQQQHQELSNGDGGNYNKFVGGSSSSSAGVGSGAGGEGIKNTKRSTTSAASTATANSKHNHKLTKQQQQQYSNHHQQQKHQYSGTNNSTTATSTSAEYSPVKLSVAGPITDL
ncbi:probable basic-leucine zipper transcription factor J isoform X2 [Calliphora vicina]|uniref:probable basic-leucine zipper transcription factor J isoform X2 n=1 Tax=Calliphora vicina TaxID=7373 RepID=UPI00325B56FC